MPCCGEPNVLIALIAGPAGGRGSRRVFVFVVPSSVVSNVICHIFFLLRERKSTREKNLCHLHERPQQTFFASQNLFFKGKPEGGKRSKFLFCVPPFFPPTTFSGGSRGLDRKKKGGRK